MGVLLVYLAGKITKNDWRNSIVKELRGHVFDVHAIYSTQPADTYIDNMYVTGPFFISCDHGCYHGHDSHGVGAYSPGQYDDVDDGYTGGCSGNGVPKSLVPSVCMKQIEESNFVFAYIDSETCYGTLLEIGYAIGRGIPVSVMFSNKKLLKDMWFIAESANIVFDENGHLKKAEIKDPEIFDASQKSAMLIASEKERGGASWEFPF